MDRQRIIVGLYVVPHNENNQHYAWA